MVNRLKPNKEQLRQLGVRTQIRSIRSKLSKDEPLLEEDDTLLSGGDKNKKLAEELVYLKSATEKRKRGEPLSAIDKTYLSTGKMPKRVVETSPPQTPSVEPTIPHDTPHEIIEHTGPKVHMADDVFRKVEVKIYKEPLVVEIFDVQPGVKVDYAQDPTQKIDPGLQRFSSWQVKEESAPRKEVADRNFVLCRLRGGGATREEMAKFFSDNPDIVPANLHDLIAFHEVFEYSKSKDMCVFAFRTDTETDPDSSPSCPSIYAIARPNGEQYIELSQTHMDGMSSGARETYVLAYKK